MATSAQTTNQVQNRLSETVLKQRIVPSMVLSPSAHNTQPWLFAVRNGTIDILIDWSRHLHVSDPSQRQLFISLGCVITNARVAARYWGYQMEVQYFPLGDGHHKPAVRLHFQPAHIEAETDAVANQLFTAIEERRTNRRMYTGQPLTSEEQKELNAITGDTLLLIENRDVITGIAELSERATFDTLARTDFKAELSQWVRSNWTRQRDGMPGYAMDMPAPISLVSSWLVKVAPIHKQEGPKARQQFESSSAVGVIVTPKDSQTDWLKAGEKFEELWLYATMLGLAVMPIAAAVESSESTRKELKNLLGTDLLPQALLRLGHTEKQLLRATPRRSLTDCLQ